MNLDDPKPGDTRIRIRRTSNRWVWRADLYGPVLGHTRWHVASWGWTLTRRAAERRARKAETRIRRDWLDAHAEWETL